MLRCGEGEHLFRCQKNRLRDSRQSLVGPVLKDKGNKRSFAQVRASLVFHYLNDHLATAATVV